MSQFQVAKFTTANCDILELTDGYLITWILSNEWVLTVHQFLLQKDYRLRNHKNKDKSVTQIEFKIQVQCRKPIVTKVKGFVSDDCGVLIGTQTGELINQFNNECNINYVSSFSPIICIETLIDHFQVVLCQNNSIIIFDPTRNHKVVSIHQHIGDPIRPCRLRCYFDEIILGQEDGFFTFYKLETKIINAMDCPQETIIQNTNQGRIVLTNRQLIDFDVFNQLIFIAVDDAIEIILVNKKHLEYIVIKVLNTFAQRIQWMDNKMFILDQRQIYQVSVNQGATLEPAARSLTHDLHNFDYFAFNGILSYIDENKIVIL